MLISNQKINQLIEALSLKLTALLQNQHFYLLAIFSTLAVLHLGMIKNHRLESENITFYILYWGGILYLLWQNPQPEKNPNLFSSLLGLGLLFLVILKPINFWHLDLILFRFGPIIAGLGLGLISFGISGLKHYWRLFFLLLLMLFPYGFINSIFNFRFKFPELTATISAFLLHYLGLGATHSGNLVKLPTGQVEVIYYCTGGLLIVWLLQLTLLIMVVVFPLTWKQRWGLLTSAFMTGFLIGCIRVAFLAVVVNDKTVFDYWHSHTGGTVFMAIATITFAALCNWILPIDFLSPQTNWNTNQITIATKRRFLLTFTWLGIILTAIYLMVSKKPILTRIFPDHIVVKNWQQVKFQPLDQYKYKDPSTDKFEIVESGQNYHYLRNSNKLVVEMRYVINTRGQANPFLSQFSKEVIAERQNNIKNLQGIGKYTLYSDGKKAYLTACINPRGGSTVTSHQFMGNRYQYDITWNRFMPWLLGHHVLRDDRCLWTQLSVPLNGSIAADIYTALESIWKNNYLTWQSLLISQSSHDNL